MSTSRELINDPLLQLLADEAMFGLDSHEHAVLDGQNLSDTERKELMQIASMIQTSFSELGSASYDEMPASLRDKIGKQACTPF